MLKMEHFIFSKIFFKNKNRLSGKIGTYVMKEEDSIEIDSIKDFKQAGQETNVLSLATIYLL